MFYDMGHALGMYLIISILFICNTCDKVFNMLIDDNAESASKANCMRNAGAQ